MSQWRFHTPDGVADILPDDCARMREIESSIRQVFRRRGFAEIRTPGLEYYDVYATGRGLAPQEDLFKFFDAQGRILALRYDGTVPAARLAATLLRDEAPPLRLSYVEPMFRYGEPGGIRQREFTQAGVELMGAASPEADAEVLCTAMEALRAAGLQDFQVSVGQVAFFKGLREAWGLSAEEADLLSRLIDSKEMVALEEMADRIGLRGDDREALLQMPSLYGSYEVLDRMEALVGNPVSRDALANLRGILEILEDAGQLSAVSVDLGMLRSLDYYTGMIVKGFTYGIGYPILSGGRYDNVVSEFGRTLSSTGFSIGVDRLMSALRRQGSPPAPFRPDVLLGAGPGRAARRAALLWADAARAQGRTVARDVGGLSPDGLRAEAEARGIPEVRYATADGRVEEA